MDKLAAHKVDGIEKAIEAKHVGAWLRRLCLGQYEPAFRDNDIDTRSLPGLTAKELKEIGGASVGHRSLLLQAIAFLPEPLTRPRHHTPTANLCNGALAGTSADGTLLRGI